MRRSRRAFSTALYMRCVWSEWGVLASALVHPAPAGHFLKQRVYLSDNLFLWMFNIPFCAYSWRFVGLACLRDLVVIYCSWQIFTYYCFIQRCSIYKRNTKIHQLAICSAIIHKMFKEKSLTLDLKISDKMVEIESKHHCFIQRCSICFQKGDFNRKKHVNK